MASQVLSGAANASYPNNTGQNVRLIINYMSNVTSMTWAEVNVTASSTTIGKDIQNITGEFRSARIGQTISRSNWNSGNLTFKTLEVGGKTNISIAEGGGGFATYAIVSTESTRPLNSRLRIFGANQTINNRETGDSATGKEPAVLPYFAPDPSLGSIDNAFVSGVSNIFYVPLTVSRGGNFPVELMLESGQSFSAVCGAFNLVAIREDGN